ncbi:MAG: family 20 glycosylhydrolase, partial [Acidobacteriota bacterium]|nr:family 20 glycosylhydrolase [Acidobacteriota bacterium]
MKKDIGLLAATCLLVAAATLTHAATDSDSYAFRNTLMPQPSSLRVGTGSLAIAPSFTVGFNGTHDELLDHAALRMLNELEAFTGIEIAKSFAKDGASATLQIHVDHPAEKIQSIDEDESYTLHVDATHITLSAPTDLGALHGFQTLLQLVQQQPSGYVVPAIDIADTPRFRWRGLMIDVGRHFEPVSEILRTLDAMESVKLNVFHWHLSEDQGFRVESLKYPKLQELGSNGLYYTQAQIREVVAYAHARGIRVVPEFDMPGHSTSWFVGYPELASGPGPYKVQTVFGIHDAAMDPTRESTYKFLDGFIGEMAELFPDAYMHIGGDESNGKQWMSNPHIRAFMKSHDIKNTAGLQVYFNQHLLKILKKYHKHMVGWDEIFTPGLPKDVVVQSWRGVDSLSKGAEQGYQGILSAPYYLDGMKTAADHYLADPIPADTTLTPDEQKKILGGEACMWAEQINENTIDSRIWPRTAAIAERFWSPASVRNVEDMYRRLDAENLRLDAQGIRQISYPQRLQRELTGSVQAPAFQTLTAILEPVSFGERYHLQHTNQLTPLNGLVDAVAPDPPVRHELNEAIGDLLSGASDKSAGAAWLMNVFNSWTTAAPHAQSMMDRSPRLSSYAVRATEMGQLG